MGKWSGWGSGKENVWGGMRCRPAGPAAASGAGLLLVEVAELDGPEDVDRCGGEKREGGKEGAAHDSGRREQGGPAGGGDAVGERLEPLVNLGAQGPVQEAAPSRTVAVHVLFVCC